MPGIRTRFDSRCSDNSARFNALNNQNTSKPTTTKTVSIKDEIKKQTTETKLTALYSNWKKNNNSDQEIEKLFEQKQKQIQIQGGTNVNKW